MKRTNMCVISLVMFYDNRTTNPEKVYRVLSCVPYSVIYNYVYIYYLYCQSKTISDISRDRVFFNGSYNDLLGSSISEVLMNLI